MHIASPAAATLAQFADSGANLTKLQSRPIVGKPWKYRFCLDVEMTADSLHKIIPEIEKDGASVTVLGSYVAAQLYPRGGSPSGSSSSFLLLIS